MSLIFENPNVLFERSVIWGLILAKKPSHWAAGCSLKFRKKHYLNLERMQEAFVFETEEVIVNVNGRHCHGHCT